MDVQQSMNKVSWFVNKIWISTKHEQYINKMQTEFKQSMKLSLHFVGTYILEEHLSNWWKFNLLTTSQFLQNSSKNLQKSSRMSPKILKNQILQFLHVSRRSIRSEPCFSKVWLWLWSSITRIDIVTNQRIMNHISIKMRQNWHGPKVGGSVNRLNGASWVVVCTPWFSGLPATLVCCATLVGTTAEVVLCSSIARTMTCNGWLPDGEEYGNGLFVIDALSGGGRGRKRLYSWVVVYIPWSSGLPATLECYATVVGTSAEVVLCSSIAMTMTWDGWLSDGEEYGNGLFVIDALSGGGRRGKRLYLWCQRFSACFVLKIAPQRGEGEKGGSANSKTKHTEPLTSKISSPLYITAWRDHNTYRVSEQVWDLDFFN